MAASFGCTQGRIPTLQVSLIGIQQNAHDIRMSGVSCGHQRRQIRLCPRRKIGVHSDEQFQNIGMALGGGIDYRAVPGSIPPVYIGPGLQQHLYDVGMAVKRRPPERRLSLIVNRVC